VIRRLQPWTGLRPLYQLSHLWQLQVVRKQVTKTESYPLQKAEDIFSSLAAEKLYTTLDLSHAYNQIPLNEEFPKLAVVITLPRDSTSTQMLPFSIASAWAIFQRAMENLVHDISGVSVYLGDILVTGKSLGNHIANLEKNLN